MAKESSKKPITKDSVYEEIRKGSYDGKTIKANVKAFPYAQELVGEGKVKKVGSNYYDSTIVPSPGQILQKISSAMENGTTLTPLEAEVAKSLVSEEKIKKVGSRYYASEFAPLTQKEAIKRLLDTGYLRKSGKKYLLVKKPLPASQEPAKLPSFFEFVETLQKIYLHKTGGYKQSTSILPLLEELKSKIEIPEALAKKWILEMPKIFIGIVDLRPFPGEPGLTLENGREVSRIYLERGIVGL